jgi:hypothetical protein
MRLSLKIAYLSRFPQVLFMVKQGVSEQKDRQRFARNGCMERRRH